MIIKPKYLKGKWRAGWALDYHTISSESLGDKQFKTLRTEIGEALYQLKYAHDLSKVHLISHTAVQFLKTRFVTKYLTAIIPVPPSDYSRSHQPVYLLAKKIGLDLNILSDFDYITRNKISKPLKDIEDFEERNKILKNAFTIDNQKYKGKKVLLLDDLYRSGATLNSISDILYTIGQVDNVYVLTITKTRVKK